MFTSTTHPAATSLVDIEKDIEMNKAQKVGGGSLS